MKINSNTWIRLSLINLCIVAFLGSLMRYKIGFELPFFEQKFIQEAHSHFAFTGWITHSLYVLLVILFRSNLDHINEGFYRALISLNLACAYGMLISFFFQGYGPFSLFFSTASLVIGYIFSFVGWKDACRLPAEHPGKNWIKAAILFMVISTIGTIVLSHMMATKQFNQTTYLGSVYLYLHFQYNGWFLFTCFGLFLDRVKSIAINLKFSRYAFWLFFLAGIPAYFLSTLWAKLPSWLYAFVVLAAILQVIGWYYFINCIRSGFKNIISLFSKPTLLLFMIVALALTFKLFLQLGSTVPAISKLAFGFRPIVIAYLHLVLLLIISVFLLTFMYGTKLIHHAKKTTVPLFVFVAGVVLNEMVLAIQGIAAFSYTIIPLVNIVLFGIALLLWISSLFLVLAHFRNSGA